MADGRRRTVAQKLDHLFRTVHPASRGPYANGEVAEAIQRASTGDSKGLSASAIQQLRTGAKKNPTMATVKALADFFGVPPAYFFDDDVEATSNAELDLLTAMRDADVKSVALRVSGLSPQGLRQIKGIIDHVRQIEGLPDNAIEDERHQP
ncbi:helix-turn-helix transcriptional regulator [Streptomyces sp. So13.3]|uniref:helix-turn-helix domain-containing protein n=1 Tax=unclassified Streptomyces TaxID=2593676 RepID=UPI00110665F1|nr:MULTISPECIES: helix-turn-helix domain-containing protein [unclassified Streptomyces]NEA75418.1 helix-turn-helix transcriptional regulator [Streptomyces sp. SID13588]QNA73152.1 helix-turn-helix transcriptional regulator [Streptomyces sp. So13.3]